MRQGRWADAIQHKSGQVAAFVNHYFCQTDRRVLLIGAAGFDPRSCLTAEVLAAVLGPRLEAVLLREERPERDRDLRPRADANYERLCGLIQERRDVEINAFSIDGAPVLGRSVVDQLRATEFERYTDVVLDFSAMSIGASFPIAAFTYECVRELDGTNLHLMVAANSAVDELIVPVASDIVAPVHGFKGGWRMASKENAAKLWMPQLATGQSSIFERIRREIDPDDIAPILPFPARHPRVGDDLISEFRAELREDAWGVGARDLVYAEEANPLDLYRTIIAIDDRRRPVFAEVGGSMLVLSPVGSKALAIGAMMAALERRLPVLYAESVGYQVDLRRLDEIGYAGTDLVHVWLHGNIYNEGPLGATYGADYDG